VEVKGESKDERTKKIARTRFLASKKRREKEEKGGIKKKRKGSPNECGGGQKQRLDVTGLKVGVKEDS